MPRGDPSRARDWAHVSRPRQTLRRASFRRRGTRLRRSALGRRRARARRGPSATRRRLWTCLGHVMDVSRVRRGPSPADGASLLHLHLDVLPLGDRRALEHRRLRRAPWACRGRVLDAPSPRSSSRSASPHSRSRAISVIAADLAPRPADRAPAGRRAPREEKSGNSARPPRRGRESARGPRPAPPHSRPPASPPRRRWSAARAAPRGKGRAAARLQQGSRNGRFRRGAAREPPRGNAMRDACAASRGGEIWGDMGRYGETHVLHLGACAARIAALGPRPVRCGVGRPWGGSATPPRLVSQASQNSARTRSTPESSRPGCPPTPALRGVGRTTGARRVGIWSLAQRPRTPPPS